MEENNTTKNEGEVTPKKNTFFTSFNQIFNSFKTIFNSFKKRYGLSGVIGFLVLFVLHIFFFALFVHQTFKNPNERIVLWFCLFLVCIRFLQLFFGVFKAFYDRIDPQGNKVFVYVLPLFALIIGLLSFILYAMLYRNKILIDIGLAGVIIFLYPFTTWLVEIIQQPL